MSNYTKSTNFATKDNLTPGDPLKIVRGTEIDTEFNNIATAIATKTDNASAAITGGSITGITDLAIADGGTGASTATAAINNLLPSQTSNANKYLQTDGTNVSWDAVSLSTADITGTLPVANGGTGVTSSTGTGSVVLSNSPTLVTPALGTPASGVATNLTGLPISTGVSGLGTGVATFLGTPSSANLASAVSDETGSGALVFANSPTLVTPALGTPSSATLTNATGLPISTGVSGLGTGVATFLATPSSANLASAVSDETGSGALVFANSPTLVTPALGTPSSGTLTNATGLPISTGVSGLGTGVATALAVNVGSAGAPVVNGGALGTPSSGTVTNLTGTASININGTVGATTANTGAFTTVTTTGTINLLTVGRGAGAVATNTAVGQSTLASNTTGVAATAFGRQALYSNTTAPYNTAVGYQAGYSTTTGRENTVVGSGAFYTNSTGGYNTAIGTDALRSNTTASNNTAVGYQARYNGTGGYDVALGYQALYTGGSGDNTALGYQALYSATGNLNTAVGQLALYSTTSGTNNVAVGHQALRLNTTANNNTAVGYQAGYLNTTGVEHTAFGYQAGYSNTTNNSSTSLGAQAGYSTTGAKNTFVGGASGYYVTTGASNTILGRYNGNQGGLDIRTSSNYIVLSDGDGNVEFTAKDGNSWALPGATVQTGTGISFPATQSASSNANTLDDYEEGTWTPTLNFGGATTGITYSDRGGYYIKIGRLVEIQFAFALTSKGSATGSATITGLPFATMSSPYISARSGGVCTSAGNIATTFNALGASIDHTSSTLNLVKLSSSPTNVADTDFSNTTTIYNLTITYVTGS